jgi:hypothetical protein
MDPLEDLILNDLICDHTASIEANKRARQRRYHDKFKDIPQLEEEVATLRRLRGEIHEVDRPAKAYIPKTITGIERRRLLSKENMRYKRALYKWLMDERARLS